MYVMRKSILLLTALIFSMLLFAQEDSRFYENADLIKLLPREGNGYLAWHDDNPDVKYWVVEVDEQRFENWEYAGEKTVWRKEVWKSNYVYIPDAYWNNETHGYMYYTNLIGFGPDNNEVIQTRFSVDGKASNPFTKQEVDPVYIEKGCAWTCNGPNWAWMIQQWKTSAGSSYYELRSASSTTEGGNSPIAYFEYMTVDNFIKMKNGEYGDRSFWNDWYGAYGPGSWEWYPSTNSPFHLIPNTGNYRDKIGHLISASDHDEVVRVFKGLGWWKRVFLGPADVVSFMTESISNPASQCIWDRNGMVDFFIVQSNILEYLDITDVQCDNASDGPDKVLCCYSGAVGGGAEESESCTTTWSWADWNNDNIVNGFDFFYYFVTECEDTGGGLPDSVDSSTSATYMTIENISNPTIPYTELTGNDYFDDNGVFNQPIFTINAGLNRMRVITKSGNEKYVVFEAKETLESYYALSNFLDVTIYPVPVVGDAFKMNIQAGATLNFTYEMFDFQGELLHSTKYSVKQGHNEVHKVISQKPIPRGLVLNRFTFEDGSVLSITTTKD